MQIRAAVASDLTAITRVQAQVMVASEHYEDSVDEELFYNRLYPRIRGYIAGTYGSRHALAERAIFVAAHEDVIIGYIAGHRSKRLGCSAELEWMFVLPQWQRMGVGGQLLQPLRALREWYVARKSTTVIVDAPPTNPCRAFYMKHGAIPFNSYWLYWENIGSYKPD